MRRRDLGLAWGLHVGIRDDAHPACVLMKAQTDRLWRFKVDDRSTTGTGSRLLDNGAGGMALGCATTAPSNIMGTRLDLQSPST